MRYRIWSNIAGEATNGSQRPGSAPADPVSDEKLMTRVQAGDTKAFGSLYDRHCGRALAVAHSVCRDRGRAEDAAQEGFLAIWRGRRGYRPQSGSFVAWAMTIIHHRAIDSVRAEAADTRPRLAPEESADTLAGPDSVEEEVIEKDRGEALRASLEGLPQAQAEVIRLAFYGGLTHTEIAAELKLPPGTVKGRMRLGLAKLRVTAEPAHRSE